MHHHKCVQLQKVQRRDHRVATPKGNKATMCLKVLPLYQMPKITAWIKSENHGADQVPMFLISLPLSLLPSTSAEWLYHGAGLHGLHATPRAGSVALRQVAGNSEKSPVVLTVGTAGTASEQSILQWAGNPEETCL